VADGVRCVPVGNLSALENPAAGYVIVGGGKTALDAICWLLDRGIDPDDITWIRPRDNWILNRAFFQPGQTRTFAGVVLQLEAMVASESVEEVYQRLEEDGVMLRTDRAVVPTMMKGGTASLRELEQLRRIGNVVRLGHVERIEPDQIVLEKGSIPTTPDHLHVHCAASRLSDNPHRAIFTDDTITLQLVTRVGLTLPGALQGFIESTGRTTEEKNALCPPTVMPHTPFDYLRVVLAASAQRCGGKKRRSCRNGSIAHDSTCCAAWATTRTAQPSESCRAVSSARCFPHSTSCRCSRRRPRHENERESSNRPRASAPEL
jgi:hypothetical protein